MAHDTQRNREILVTARQPYTEIRRDEALKRSQGAFSHWPCDAMRTPALAAQGAFTYDLPSQPHTGSRTAPHVPGRLQPPGPSHPAPSQYSLSVKQSVFERHGRVVPGGGYAQSAACASSMQKPVIAQQCSPVGH
jgi:hypothetical protein